MIDHPWKALGDARQAASLEPGVVDLWCVDLRGQGAPSAAILAADERERQARFVFPRDAQDFGAARGYLRVVLGAYLDVDPAALAFAYGVNGKPMLEAPACAPVRFNLSHAGGLALIGVALDRDVGVDLEAVREMNDWRDIASGTFAASEARGLGALDPSRQLEGFFACWTRKEAVVKLSGAGFSADLTAFSVEVDPRAGVQTVSVDASSVRLWSFKPAPGYWAAVAVHAARDDVDVRFRRLD